jgi:hypothetical protein
MSEISTKHIRYKNKFDYNIKNKKYVKQQGKLISESNFASTPIIALIEISVTYNENMDVMRIMQAIQANMKRIKNYTKKWRKQRIEDEKSTS